MTALAQTTYVNTELDRKSTELQMIISQTKEELNQKMDQNQEHTASYLKGKFDAIQEKQFTVPKLCGEGGSYPYENLGEFLYEYYNDTRKSLKALNEVTVKTHDHLKTLQEYVDQQLKHDVPSQFSHTSETLNKKIDR